MLTVQCRMGDMHAPDFPGETFRILKEKEERELGE